MGKKAERIRKENKNLSGNRQGGGEGGESRVQNSPKAFGELKNQEVLDFKNCIW